MKTTSRVCGSALVFAALLAGCSSDDGTGGDDASHTTSASTGGEAGGGGGGGAAAGSGAGGDAVATSSGESASTGGGGGDAHVPSDERMLFTTNDGTIVSTFTDGTDLHTVSPAGQSCHDAAWSPDGQRILFACGDETAEHLYAADADGANASVVFPTPDWPYGGVLITHPSWSPQGRIALALEPASGGSPVNVATIAEDGTDLEWVEYPNATGGSPTWSPDGSALVVYAGAAVYLIHDGSEPLELVAQEDGLDSPDFAWAPDGKSLVYSGLTWSPDYATRMYRLAADGSSSSLIYSNVDECFCPSLSRDGQTLAFDHFLGVDPWYAIDFKQGEDAPVESLPGLHCPRYQP
jgi:WD40 repeat protein